MFDEQENTQNINQTQSDNSENIENEIQEQSLNPESSIDRNLRALREKSERLQRERDEALNYIKNIEAKNTQITQVEEDDFTMDPDALAEGKHISKVNSKIKKLEQQLKTYQQQSQESITEARLKARYSDFDSVVSRDNIDVLRKSHPEIWQTIDSTSDLYNKAVSAYTLIKELRIAADETYNPDKAIVQKNASKPRPLTSMSPQQGDTPLSKANAFAEGLSDELRKQLWKEIQSAKQNY